MKRIHYISVIRVLAMIAVVFYHCLCGYSDIWGGKFSWDIVPLWNKMAHILALFHMPVFIMISSFLFSYVQKNGGYASFTTYIYKKIKRVLVPYIIWGLFVCFLMKDNVSNLLQGYSHLWFLMFIFEAYISYFLIDRLITRYHLEKVFFIFSLMFLCASNYIATHYCNNLLFTMSQYVLYMPYYIIGVYLHKYKGKIKLPSLFLNSSVILAFIVFIYSRYWPIKSYVTNISCLIIIIYLLYICSRFTESKFVTLIMSFDKYCIGIYLIHHIIIQEMNMSELGHHLMSHYMIYPLLQFVFVLFFSVIITKILLRNKIGKLIIGS